MFWAGQTYKWLGLKLFSNVIPQLKKEEEEEVEIEKDGE